MSYSHILKYTGLLGSVQFLNILISIVRNKAAAVLIGPVGMGLADLYFRTIDLLGNSTNFGLGFSAVRRLSPLCEQGNLRALKLQSQIIRTMIFWTALLGAIVTIVLSPALSLWLFHDTSHALSICALAPAVAFNTLTSGEVAILRGTSRLKAIASTSALVAGCTLLFALVIYSIWGISGVIPVLLLTTLATFLLHLRVSTRQFPYHISPFRFRALRSGRSLIQLGAAYVGAGILGSGTEMLIRATVVNSENGLYAAGLYAAGLTLTVSYTRMIFVTMDADYFPRLSAATQDISRQNLTVNSQIHVLSLLMAPFLIILAISLPLVVRLLYSAEYLPVMPMVWAALPFMYFKSIYSPIAYLSLAHGDSRVYFVMELLYDVVFAAAVVVGYQYYGLLGAGIGLSLANLADLLLLSLFYRKKYQFRFTRQGALLFLPQGILLLGVLCCMLLESAWLRYGISGALCCISVLFSFIQLKKLWRSRPTA